MLNTHEHQPPAPGQALYLLLGRPLNATSGVLPLWSSGAVNRCPLKVSVEASFSSTGSEMGPLGIPGTPTTLNHEQGKLQKLPGARKSENESWGPLGSSVG